MCTSIRLASALRMHARTLACVNRMRIPYVSRRQSSSLSARRVPIQLYIDSLHQPLARLPDIVISLQFIDLQHHLLTAHARARARTDRKGHTLIVMQSVTRWQTVSTLASSRLSAHARPLSSTRKASEQPCGCTCKTTPRNVDADIRQHNATNMMRTPYLPQLDERILSE